MNEQLLQAAREAGMQRARPRQSNFSVGAALSFSDGSIFSGGNYEDLGKTTVGACAERTTLMAANNQIGPIGGGSHVVGSEEVIWKEAGLWANIPHPVTPCGICRDALAASSSLDSIVFSRGEASKAEFIATMQELLPLAGRGPLGDVQAEVELMLRSDAKISRDIDAKQRELLALARETAARSYIPPFSKSEAPSGAALQTQDGQTFSGWFTTEATTRLGGSAVTNAVRSMLQGSPESLSLVTHVALFVDSSKILKAPTGTDLQMLQEVACSKEIPIVFSNAAGQAYSTTLATLYPHSFGRPELGY